MNDSKWPDTRELWVCLNCGSVEWHLRGEVKAVLCECVAGVWTAMEQVWPAPWISVEERRELPEEWRGLVWQQEPVSMGRWTIGRWILKRWVSDRYIPLRCVTHYQPGPSAPE